KKTSWALTQPSSTPTGFRLDTQALSRLASSLASLRASDFAEVTDDVAGFAAPHTVVTGVTSGGNVVLHLGNLDDKKRVYARVDGDSQIYLVPEFSAKNLDKRLGDLRDTNVFVGGEGRSAADVVAASFVGGSERVVLKRGDGGFTVVEPKKVPEGLDVAQAESVVASALRLKGTRIVDDASDIKAGGPSIELTFKDGGKQLVRFGSDDVDNEVRIKGADGLVYGAAAALRTRYTTPIALFKTPPAPPAGGMGGMGGMGGLDSLPPDVRAKLEASMRQQGMQ
ncbi:MAG TPA: DUF4340 domain-containing protein, partial [Myxococcota bacterium]